jgi:cytochrome c553
MRRQRPGRSAAILAVLWLVSGAAGAAKISDISNTRHNFSATVEPAGVTRAASATSESQICAFCHTPHGAAPEQKAPLWNRQLSQATYIPYSSTSVDATDLGQPGGKSKLCLSCHDGTIALGAVNVLNRTEGQTVQFSGTSDSPPGTIPEGLGSTTGFTRRLGVDLTNDHPISFTYDSALAARDGELYTPTVPHQRVFERTRGSSPAMPQGDYLPLETDAAGTGPKVECISCHDPHIRSDVPGENIKFLRANRLQSATPVENQFDGERDIICLACHEKEGWAGSAHAHPAVADERYTDAAADLREFPRDTRAWQAACLNCHDPHTVQGARRLLREGTDSTLQTDPVTGGQYKQGGNPGIEYMCYACHGDPAVGSNVAQTAQTLQGQISPSNNIAFEVPDVKTDFTTMLRHMPISSADQIAGQELHSIGTGNPATQGGAELGQDFIESPDNLGLVGGTFNRHAECTDCHNPHRVAKTRQFNDDNTVPAAAGTHMHEDGVPHTNLASGVLRGMWGVEPVYSNTAFLTDPVTFEVKRGDPGTGGSTDVSAPYLTREYQLCLKCHSNYAYGSTPPPLGYTSGLTPAGTNALGTYTNQAMEYQSPIDHMGEGTPASPTGAYNSGAACTDTTLDDNGTPLVINGRLDPQGNCSDYVNDNHRSWHPVLRETGRTPAVRRADANDWRSPFNVAVGTQTMYCADCHGSRTGGDTVVPVNGENGYPWGPHGSNENFLLKGRWTDQTGENTVNFANEADPSNDLCFRCHDPKQYARTAISPDPQVLPSGFRRQVGGGGCLQFMGLNLHVGHAGQTSNFRCTYCHVAIPHGWKNKTFLANLNDVGLEASLPAGTQVRYSGFPQSGTGRYYQGPYYNGAVNKVRKFARSGEWLDVNCGSTGTPGNGVPGVQWMNNTGESCVNMP